MARKPIEPIPPDLEAVDVIVMGYPGAVMLRLEGKVRKQYANMINVEIGGYVLNYLDIDLRQGVEHDWRPGIVRPEVVLGMQQWAVPVERYNERIGS